MAEPASPELGRALLEEATRKAGLVWLSYETAEGPIELRPAWHVWLDGAAYVVCGGREQVLPGLPDAVRATVVVPSKDTRARVVAWPAAVEVVAPADTEWSTISEALAGKRLNAEGGAAMIDRWTRESSVVRLRPAGEVTEWAGDPSAVSLAAPPRPTAATTIGRQPLMIGGLRRRGR